MVATIIPDGTSGRRAGESMLDHEARGAGGSRQGDVRGKYWMGGVVVAAAGRSRIQLSGTFCGGAEGRRLDLIGGLVRLMSKRRWTDGPIRGSLAAGCNLRVR